VRVRQPRIRDRGDGAIRFTSAILPRYPRRAKSLEDLLPWLYPEGISTGDFSEALAALLGTQAPGAQEGTDAGHRRFWPMPNGWHFGPCQMVGTLAHAKWLALWPMPNGWQWRARSDRPSNRWRARSSLWKALREVFGSAREQRCWAHKTGNVLNKLPRACGRRPSSTRTTSGWPRPGRRPKPPLTSS